MEPTNKAKPVRQKELSEKIEDFLVANFKAVIGAFIAVVVLAGVYAFSQTIISNREKAAQEELFTVTNALEKKITDINEAAQKDVKKDPKAAPKEVEKTPETLVRDLGPQVEKLEAFVKTHEDRKAGFMAAMTLSDVYLDYQSPKKAVEVLNRVADKPSKDDLLYGLLNAQYALALSNSNNCQDAVGVYDRIIENKDQKFLHAQAMLRKGVCLMTLDKLDQAKSVFQEARTEFPDSMSGRSAESFERYIALKKSQAK